MGRSMRGTKVFSALFVGCAAPAGAGVPADGRRASQCHFPLSLSASHPGSGSAHSPPARAPALVWLFFLFGLRACLRRSSIACSMCGVFPFF